jgi:hypothetical protein
MKNRRYYIHTASTSLSHYFARGCIVPATYIQNKIVDTQDIFPDYIIISTSKWNEKSDCSIEILLTPNDEKSLQNLSENYFVLSSVLPVSRVTQINFLNQGQAETTVWNINNGAGYVPKHILNVEKTKDDICSDKLEDIVLPEDYKPQNLKKKIHVFDMLMGGFALMKIGTGDPRDLLISYSQNYISTLSYFNINIQEELLAQKIVLSPKYHGLFNAKETHFQRYLKYIGSKVDVDLLRNVAKSENILLEEKFGTLVSKSIPQESLSFVLSIFLTYGNSRNKSIDNLVSDIVAGAIDQEVVEKITLLFGLHNGYKDLRNSYTTAGLSKKVKYDFTSLLDYVTVESLFNYAFSRQQISKDMDYLKELVPQVKNIKGPKGYVAYKVFDTLIVTQKKDYLEYLENISNIISKDISSWFPSDLGLAISSLQRRFEEKIKPTFNSLVSDIIAEANKEEELLNKKISELSNEVKQLKSAPDKASIDTVDPLPEEKLKTDEKSPLNINSGEDIPQSLEGLKKANLQEILQEHGVNFKNKDSNATLRSKINALQARIDLFSKDK